jgi:hypothetical protein
MSDAVRRSAFQRIVFTFVALALLPAGLFLFRRFYVWAESYDGRKIWGPIEGDWIGVLGIALMLACWISVFVLIRLAIRDRPRRHTTS